MGVMSTDHAPIPRVANRYGAPKPSLKSSAKRRIVWAVLAVAVIGTAIFSLMTGIKPVTFKDVGFNVSDSTSARVDFDVTKAPDATTQCAIQVLNESYAIVGWKVVTIGPTSADEGIDNGRTTAHSTDLRTESLGVTGGVNSCWMVESP